MRNLIAGIVVGIVLSLAGVAYGETLAVTVGLSEPQQDLRIWQVRTVVRDDFDDNARLWHRVRLIECGEDTGCINGENLAWQMLGSQWPGWPTK